MRERRRLKLLERQLQLALVERHRTLAALAGAAGEEARSEALARRTWTIAASYGDTIGIETGAALSDRIGFSGSLEAVARSAQVAAGEAGVRAHAHIEELARLDTRKSRIAERIADARRMVRQAMYERDAPVAGLARSLQPSAQKRGSQGETAIAHDTQRALAPHHNRSRS